MTGHFGIETDFDLDTTEELKHLKRLWNTVDRSKEQQGTLEDLAKRLASKSHTIALEIYLLLREDSNSHGQTTC